MNVCKCLLKIKFYLEFPRNSICKVSWNVKFRQTSRTFSQKYQFIFAIFFESTFIIHWLFFNIHEKCCLPLMKKKNNNETRNSVRISRQIFCKLRNFGIFFGKVWFLLSNTVLTFIKKEWSLQLYWDSLYVLCNSNDSFCTMYYIGIFAAETLVFPYSNGEYKNCPWSFAEWANFSRWGRRNC